MVIVCAGLLFIIICCLPYIIKCYTCFICWIIVADALMCRQHYNVGPGDVEPTLPTLNNAD